MTRIDEIRQRLESATPGDWHGERTNSRGHKYQFSDFPFTIPDDLKNGDQIFISHAKDDVQFLLTEVEKAQDDTQAELNFQEKLEDLLGLDNIGAIGSGIIDAIQKLQAASRWIPVGERLPEEDHHVMGVTRRGLHFTGWYNSEHGWVTVDRGSIDETVYREQVTHWMPLPAPPKEGGENG